MRSKPIFAFLESSKGDSKNITATITTGEGCGGAASGRAVAFCLSRPGSIPGTDLLGFFRFRIAANLFSLGAGLFLKNEE